MLFGREANRPKKQTNKQMVHYNNEENKRTKMEEENWMRRENKFDWKLNAQNGDHWNI